MARIVKEPSQAILERCLELLRQGAGTEHPRASKEKQSLRDLFSRMQASAGSTHLLEAPAMALFSAMTQSAQDFDAACEKAPSELIEMTFAQAMEASGFGKAADAASPHTKLDYTPLQMATIGDQWREARSLLARGANPNLFNAQVTAIGMAAYIGAARCLCEMISFGANATLYLPPEHAPGSSWVHGSTLLHRVANRPIGPNKRAVILILGHDEASYPDPQPKTIDGQTPLDWTEGDAEAALALVEAIAGREAIDLERATQGPSDGASTRLRV